MRGRRIRLPIFMLCLFFLLGAVFGRGSGTAAIIYAEEAEDAEALQEPQIALYAQSAVLMDADSGRILYEKNGYDPRPMASTTKIMTCILALENGDPEDIYTVSSYAASMPKVKLGAMAGEAYRLGDLLYSLMLESHNDTAVVIAEGIAGSVEGFAEKMNQKAAEIGAAQTYFITPNGLDAEDETGIHSTTAADLARILRYCITESPKREEFLAITRTASYSFQDVNGTRNHLVTNRNSFLSMMEGALTGKTGFTGNAGYCYVGALSRDGKTYIVALLACGWPNNKNYKWKDTITLMNYGLEAYAYQEICDGSRLTGEIAVTDGKAEKISVSGEGNVTALIREGEQIRILWWQEGELSAPVEAGREVGHIRVYVGDTCLAKLPVKTVGAVEARTFSDCADEIFAYFFLRNPEV